MLYEFSFTVQPDSRNNWRHFTRVVESPALRHNFIPTELIQWANHCVATEIANATTHVELYEFHPARVGYKAGYNQTNDRASLIYDYTLTT